MAIKNIAVTGVNAINASRLFLFQCNVPLFTVIETMTVIFLNLTLSHSLPLSLYRLTLFLFICLSISDLFLHLYIDNIPTFMHTYGLLIPVCLQICTLLEFRFSCT